MPLTCPLLLLFLLELENHLSQNLKFYIEHEHKKLAYTYCFLCFLLLEPPSSTPAPPSHQKKKIFRFGFFVKIHLLESSKLEL